MSFFSRLPEKGSYTLIILVSNKVSSTVGKLGVKIFLPGYYAYTESALGKGATSLPKRLARHLRTVKRKHWHIDFLLAQKVASIKAAAITSFQNSECPINQFIKNRLKAKIWIPKFGATDCKNDCKSHLLYFGNKNIKRKIHGLFERRLGNSSSFLDSNDIRSLESSNFELLNNCLFTLLSE